MKKLLYLFSIFLCSFAFDTIQAEASYVVMTASNDANNNELLVYDAAGKSLQSIPTKGKGEFPQIQQVEA